MYISAIKIKNYRNFGDPAFEMPLKPFTVILGENNAGKTNLFNAIGLILSQDITVFKKRMLELDDINYNAIRAFKEQLINEGIPPDQVEFPEVVIEVILSDMTDDQLAVAGDWLINKELTEAKLTYRFSLRPNWNRKVEWVEQQRELARKKTQQELVATAVVEEVVSPAQAIPSEGLFSVAGYETIVEEATPKVEVEKELALVDFPIDNYEYVIYGGDDPSNKCDPYYLRMLKMEHLDALRDAKKELIANGDYRLLYKILNKKDPAGYVDIKLILSELDAAVRNNKNLSEIKKEVSDLLDRVSLQENNKDNNVDFNFSSPETTEILKKISMTFGSQPMNVERNGLGRNNLLYISLALSQLTDGGSSENILFRFIGIEEPEAHLHPHLQNHLAENIESIGKDRKDIQLVLTSLSTHIASKLSLENTVTLFLDRGTNTTKHHYVLNGIDAVAEKPSINYLTKYLDATKSTLFFSRKVILVEGISEQLLVPRLFELSTKNKLDKVGCSVINVNGVAFSHFLKVIRNGYFVKCIVLTDSDEGTKTENRAESLKAEFEVPQLIQVNVTQQGTFEKDLIEANKKGKGRAILLRALIATKPKAGPELQNALGNNDLDIEAFFKQIEKYKSEFAFNLLEELKSSDGFIIPEYMKAGFTFLS